MVNYLKKQSSVAAKITAKGQSLTFGRKPVTSFDPGLGKKVTTPTTFTAYGVTTRYRKSEIDGTVIQSGDVGLLLEVSATTPIVGDTVTVNSIIYRVMGIDPVSPGGVDILYKLNLRK